jgi:branched-chain amino acid transport system substrate-binding protein
MGRNIVASALLCAVASLAAAACGGTTNPTAASSAAAGGKQAGPIVIGAAIATTGFMTSFDTPDMNGFKIAMNEVNSRGGINGRKIKLITENTQSTTSGAKQAATDLISKGAQILLVTANFDVGSPAGIVAEDKGILNVSIGAASPDYGVQGIGPLAFTVAPATYLEGATLAQLSKQQGWLHPFLLDDTSLDYSTQLCQGFKDQAARLGLKTSETTFQNSDQSVAAQLAQIKSSGADAIALCSYTPGGATAMRQIRAAGIDLPTLGGIGMAGTYWLSAVPKLSNFYTASSASIYGDDPNPQVNSFVTQYVKDYGGLPSTDAAVGGYAAGQMIFQAIKEAGGNTTGSAVAARLSQFSNVALLPGPTTYTSTVHIPASRPLKIIKYTDGKPAYSETLPVSGTVNLHIG